MLDFYDFDKFDKYEKKNQFYYYSIENDPINDNNEVLYLDYGDEKIRLPICSYKLVWLSQLIYLFDK